MRVTDVTSALLLIVYLCCEITKNECKLQEFLRKNRFFRTKKETKDSFRGKKYEAQRKNLALTGRKMPPR